MIILALIVGLFAGLIGGFFGISGAFLILTCLSSFKMVADQKTAIGTTLFVLLPPISILALWHYYKNKQIDFKLGLYIMLTYIIGAGLGARFTSDIKEKQLKLYIFIMFVCLSIISFISFITYTKKPSSQPPSIPLRFPQLI
jgi:uncharacterized membrane protein YfcA